MELGIITQVRIDSMKIQFEKEILIVQKAEQDFIDKMMMSGEKEMTLIILEAEMEINKIVLKILLYTVIDYILK